MGADRGASRREPEAGVSSGEQEVWPFFFVFFLSLLGNPSAWSRRSAWVAFCACPGGQRGRALLHRTWNRLFLKVIASLRVAEFSITREPAWERRRGGIASEFCYFVSLHGTRDREVVAVGGGALVSSGVFRVHHPG